MQRIDESISIDDTLVTCAEYQLFIDEAHKKRKYHQPDHWVSSQYPEGHARQSVLGIRHSDALAFCEWLSQQENNGYYYRLPTETETKKYSLKPIQHIFPLGYWITSTNEQVRFAWQDPISAIDKKNSNDHNYHFKKVLDLDLDLDQVHNIGKGSIRRLARALIRTIDRGPGRDLTQAHNILRTIEKELPFDLWKDLGILQYRIAGRSHAFEGIRLVKERTR